jgi:hypothetical protein
MKNKESELLKNIPNQGVFKQKIRETLKILEKRQVLCGSLDKFN